MVYSCIRGKGETYIRDSHIGVEYKYMCVELMYELVYELMYELMYDNELLFKFNNN